MMEINSIKKIILVINKDIDTYGNSYLVINGLNELGNWIPVKSIDISDAAITIFNNKMTIDHSDKNKETTTTVIDLM
jgi:hypothetical protein